MKWEPKLNHDTCNKWLSSLKDIHLYNTANSVVHLIPPFKIVINQIIYEKIKKIYLPSEEKGGLMFASVVIEENVTYLIIQSVEDIKNDVEKHFPGFKKEHSYFPNIEKYNSLLSDNFSKTDIKKILIPINFHTHPTETTNQDLMYFDEVIRQLKMSSGDKECAAKWKIMLNSFELLSLNAIITGDSIEHRIIFYGYKVTPMNFSKVKSEQLIQSAEKFLNNIESDGWRLFAGICLFGLTAVATINAPEAVCNAYEEIVHSIDKKEFWGKLEEGTTIINIPVRNESELD